MEGSLGIFPSLISYLDLPFPLPLLRGYVIDDGETGEDPSYFTAAFKHGSSHGGCNVNGPKVAKFLDG